MTIGSLWAADGLFGHGYDTNKNGNQLKAYEKTKRDNKSPIIIGIAGVGILAAGITLCIIF